MRATRTAPALAIALALLLGTSMAATSSGDLKDAPGAISQVTGTTSVDLYLRTLVTSGSMARSTSIATSPSRARHFWRTILGSPVRSIRHGTGISTGPARSRCPAWGTMRIEATEVSAEAGSWQGAFTGIRRTDGEPFAVRALLFGDGAFGGLCATLDIQAGPGDWMIDGVVHPDPMAG